MILGFLLPESVLFSRWFAVLSAFVAINTVMYGTLALLKSLPAWRMAALRKRRYVRSQTRSIYPDAVEAGPGVGEGAQRPAQSAG